MHKPRHLPYFIRTIDSPPAEGGSGQETEPETGGDGQRSEDWKARFEQERRHSRTWEERAKSNSKAAEELKALRESQMSDQQKAQARARELEAQVAAFQAERQQTQWRAEVSRDTGVPADLLTGSTREEMQDMASRLDGYLHPKPTAPLVADPSKTPKHKAENQQMNDFIGRLFGQ